MTSATLTKYQAMQLAASIEKAYPRSVARVERGIHAYFVRANVWVGPRSQCFMIFEEGDIAAKIDVAIADAHALATVSRVAGLEGRR